MLQTEKALSIKLAAAGATVFDKPTRKTGPSRSKSTPNVTSIMTCHDTCGSKLYVKGQGTLPTLGGPRHEVTERHLSPCWLKEATGILMPATVPRRTPALL